MLITNFKNTESLFSEMYFIKQQNVNPRKRNSV